MTTIAYRDGWLAADTRYTVGSLAVPNQFYKIRRLADGRLVALAGNPYLFDDFVAWLADPIKRHRPDLKDDSAAFVVGADGLLKKYAYSGSILIIAPFAATGSGMEAAMAAMYMGADARRAVEIAALLDPYTGGEIQVERL